MPGPIPKRSEERRRRNTDVPIDQAPAGEDSVPIPPPNPEWHPIAFEWYDSLARSGQSVYYEASDWATAVYVAEAMSRNLYQANFSAHLFASIMAATSSLMTTEGERRRLRLELTREKDGEQKESAGVTALNDYRRALGG